MKVIKRITIWVLILIFSSGQIAFAATSTLDTSKDMSIIKTAKQYLGVKYVYGGTTPKGFDCSGYVQYVFNKHNKKLPRTADVQYSIGKPITKISDLKPGDLVFFATGEPKDINHVGIYIGGEQFINAQTSKGVAIANMLNPIGSRNILEQNEYYNTSYVRCYPSLSGNIKGMNFGH